MTARLVAIAAATAAAAVITACAGARPAPPPAQPSRQVVTATLPDAGADAAPPVAEVPSLEDLAARGPTEMPLMREVLRSDDATKPSLLEVRAADACLRAIVAAGAPVRAWFEDEKHVARGAELTAATSGLVPPRGPACARKGETLRLVVDAQGAAVTARAVVWQAP